MKAGCLSSSLKGGREDSWRAVGYQFWNHQKVGSDTAEVMQEQQEDGLGSEKGAAGTMQGQKETPVL